MDSSNWLGVGRRGDGSVYIESFGKTVSCKEAVNLCAWLRVVLESERDQVEALEREIYGGSAKAAAGPPEPALNALRAELERVLQQYKVGLIHERPGTAERQFHDGYVAGIERVLGLMAGARTLNVEPKTP